MKNSRLSLNIILLILPLILFVVASCDSDTNNMIVPDIGEQEMDEPSPMDVSCPCFTVDDLVTAGGQADLIECGNIVFGLAFIPNNSGPFSAQCNSTGTKCGCGNADDVMDINQNEYGACINNMINGLIQINSGSLKIEGCEAPPIFE